MKTTIDLLVELWRNRLDSLITIVATGQRDHLEIHRSAQHVGADYHGRFLIELIQNANDQAILGGRTDTVIKVVRSDKLVVVTNEGEPFDAGKVADITSIFLSSKPADICIGNKGVGFKAVFEVAEGAEIYSAATGRTLTDDCTLAFKIDRHPLKNTQLQTRLRELIKSLLQDQPEREEALRNRRPDVDPTEQILSEAGKAAWFKFPLPAAREDLVTRLQELNLDESFLERCQTLVALPLRDDDRTRQISSQAIQEAVGIATANAAPPDSTRCLGSLLFLDGVREIEIADQVNGIKATLTKGNVDRRERLPSGREIYRFTQKSEIKTIASTSTDQTQVDTQEWWVAERTLGDDTACDASAARQEREQIRKAIEVLDLPENWRAVERAKVSVAIPLSTETRVELSAMATLETGGLFCIGLPTRVGTGSPFWVNAHFHGTIARTQIEFAKNDYNRLLLAEAVELVTALVGRFKQDEKREVRRCATLAMRRGQGHLADLLYAPGGLAESEVVLSRDGSTFLRAADLRLPAAEDAAVFEILVEDVEALDSYGFRLPDSVLLRTARSLLEGLAGSHSTSAALEAYAVRPDGHQSLLELAARKHRRDGPSFWEVFLSWVVERLQNLAAIMELEFLPIATDELAAPAARVFFPPAPVAGEDQRSGEAEEDPELEVVDDDMARLLKFFDSSAIQIRTGRGRILTELARRLAPKGGDGLVSLPVRKDLINHALSPALQRAVNDRDTALKLLHQILVLLLGLRRTDAIQKSKLLVPTLDPDGAWKWRNPEEVYLGRGWQDGRSDYLLCEAYGQRHDAQLVPWPDFEAAAKGVFHTVERRWWVDGMRLIGVWSTPRILTSDKRIAPLLSYSYDELTIDPHEACPLPAAAPWWQQYVEAIRHRRVPTMTYLGERKFYLRNLTWIDGLENSDIRPFVVELILRAPNSYLPDSITQLERHDRAQSTDVPNLWLHALRNNNWPVIPTSHGPRAPGSSWWVEFDQRGERFTHLACVPSEYVAARPLLLKLGVATVESPSPQRIVTALHHLAQRIPNCDLEARRSLEALVADFYELLDKALATQDNLGIVQVLIGAPIPLLRGQRLVAGDLKEVDRLLVDDDPIRRQFIQGLEQAWVLPKRSHETHSNFIKALAAYLGEGKVVKLSAMPIMVGFTPRGESVPLLDYVDREFPGLGIDLDIALLIVIGGYQVTSPRGDRFKRQWGVIKRTKVQFGEFESSPPLRVCFDEMSPDGPTLMVEIGQSATDVIAGIWQIVGLSYRDLYQSYSGELARREHRAFLCQRGVTERDRADVEDAIERGFAQRLGRYQPVLFALWLSHNPDHGVVVFIGEWEKSTKTLEDAAKWLGVPNLIHHLSIAEENAEPTDSLALLAQFGLSVRQWQQARIALGHKPYRFEESVRCFGNANRMLAAQLMALVAYVAARGSREDRARVGNSSEALQNWIESVHTSEPSASITEECDDELRIIAAAAHNAAGLMGNGLLGEPFSSIAKALRELAEAPPLQTFHIKLQGAVGREADIYLDCSSELRTAEAKETVEGILRVACELAGKLGEQLDAVEVRSDSRVLFLSDTWWANRFAVLAALSRSIEALAPKTSDRLKQVKAFATTEDWRSLWQKLTELGAPPPDAGKPLPKPVIEVLGLSLTEDEFSQSASQGLLGEVAIRLQKAIDMTLNLEALRTGNRGLVRLTGTKRRLRKTGGRSFRESDAEKRVLGALGEWFVFQQFSVLLDGFDHGSWVSENRAVFGFGGRGNDSLGYDFEYRDKAGMLTGRENHPMCRIEVKSTTGDGSNPFEMSSNEWEEAQHCHYDKDRGIYVLVRVANVKSFPRITDVMIDPVQLRADGVLDYKERDLVVYVGSRG